jgi:hypothetical protein
VRRKQQHSDRSLERPLQLAILPGSLHAPTDRKPRRKDRHQMNGAPGTIRTSDPQIRSLVLYPAELRARSTVACEARPLDDDGGIATR